MGGKVLDYPVKQSYKEGFAEGQVIGEKRGEKRGEENLGRLTQLLLARQRYADLERATRDEVYLKQMYREFGIKG